MTAVQSLSGTTFYCSLGQLSLIYHHQVESPFLTVSNIFELDLWKRILVYFSGIGWSQVYQTWRDRHKEGPSHFEVYTHDCAAWKVLAVVEFM